MKLKRFLKQETVLSVAAVLAVLSMFFVPPDADYLGYIDLRTLAILFSLMTIMAGLRRQGVFDRMGRALLARTGSTLQLVLVLVGLCFFGSMIITNDVSLLTFVPFTFVVLSGLAPDTRRALTIPVVCMQTIAANLGSMLTPIGNPQNLYLYGKSGMSMAEFLLLMFPSTRSFRCCFWWAGRSRSAANRHPPASVRSRSSRTLPQTGKSSCWMRCCLRSVCWRSSGYCPTALPLPLCWSVPSALTAPLSAMWITPCC